MSRSSMRAEADRVAAMDADELDLLIGEAVLRDSMFSKPLSDEEVRAAGREYFQSLLPALRERLCRNSVVAAVFSEGTKDRNTLITELAEQLFGIELPLALAARVLYFGFERLCPREPTRG
jgi:hypothetical protein